MKWSQNIPRAESGRPSSNSAVVNDLSFLRVYARKKWHGSSITKPAALAAGRKSEPQKIEYYYIFNSIHQEKIRKEFAQ